MRNFGLAPSPNRSRQAGGECCKGCERREYVRVQWRWLRCMWRRARRVGVRSRSRTNASARRMESFMQLGGGGAVPRARLAAGRCAGWSPASTPNSFSRKGYANATPTLHRARESLAVLSVFHPDWIQSGSDKSWNDRCERLQCPEDSRMLTHPRLTLRTQEQDAQLAAREQQEREERKREEREQKHTAHPADLEHAMKVGLPRCMECPPCHAAAAPVAWGVSRAALPCERWLSQLNYTSSQRAALHNLLCERRPDHAYGFGSREALCSYIQGQDV